MVNNFWESTLRPQLAYVVTRGMRRLWSSETWLIFALNLSGKSAAARWTRCSPGQSRIELTIRSLTPHDVEEVVRIYPPEFRYAMTDAKIRADIQGKLKRKVHGFVAQENGGRLLGAQWCLEAPMSVLRGFPPLDGWRWFESLNLFVIPEARGRRVAALLRSGAFQQMVNDGYNLAISLVRIDRHNSIRHNLRFDGRLIGFRSYKSRFGIRKWTRTALAEPK